MKRKDIEKVAKGLLGTPDQCVCCAYRIGEREKECTLERKDGRNVCYEGIYSQLKKTLRRA